jgi:hypothetical protein
MYILNNMAVHIANPEVEKLIERYQRQLGTTKTDAIRQALQLALAQPREALHRKQLMRTGFEIIQRARAQKRAPLTKQESDALYKYLETT